MDKRRTLIERIMTQYEDGAGGSVYPVVEIDEFFEGNTDESSIAPNLVGYGHPGLEVFRDVLASIRTHPDVQAVLIAILECPADDDASDDDMWPAAECVYVLTSAPQNTVEDWAKSLRHDGAVEGWSGETKPRVAPDVRPGFRVVTLTWD